LRGDDDPGLIYICMSGDNVAKIGLTRRRVYERLKSFNTSAVEPWRIIGEVRVRLVEETEQAIHTYLWEKRIHANRELFTLTEDEAKEILAAVEETAGLPDPAIAAINAIGRRR
jgi:T5orf172 domain